MVIWAEPPVEWVKEEEKKGRTVFIAIMDDRDLQVSRSEVGGVSDTCR